MSTSDQHVSAPAGALGAMPGNGPHAPRAGRLRNGGTAAPGWGPDWPGRRCGALTRHKAPCQAPAMAGKARCRLHGGASTGPKTAEGRERCRQARLKHGRYTQEARAQRKALFAAIRAAVASWKAAQEGGER